MESSRLTFSLCRLSAEKNTIQDNISWLNLCELSLCSLDTTKIDHLSLEKGSFSLNGHWITLGQLGLAFVWVITVEFHLGPFRSLGQP